MADTARRSSGIDRIGRRVLLTHRRRHGPGQAGGTLVRRVGTGKHIERAVGAFSVVSDLLL